MGRSGSDRHNQSSGISEDVRKANASDTTCPEAAGRRYDWWDWREHVEDLDAPVQALAEALVRRVEDRVGPEELRRTLAGQPREVGRQESWNAVARLHRSLDQARQDAPPEEFSEARRRLDDVCGELWEAGTAAELAAVREFVCEIGHDLRSPLHSILFLTDALFREESGSLTWTQKRQVSVVHSAAAALLRMANDLLDFSRASGGPSPDEIEAMPFSPVQVVDELANLLEPVAHHHKARLDTELESSASRVGDPQVLNRVLLNLACNALEAVEEDGIVRIRVTGDQEGLCAVVEDDSGDVDPEKIRELADGGSYSQVVRRLGGESRGLGLVICGRLVRVADGDLGVERTDDGWTRISVSLPFPALEDEEAV